MYLVPIFGSACSRPWSPFPERLPVAAMLLIGTSMAELEYLSFRARMTIGKVWQDGPAGTSPKKPP